MLTDARYFGWVAASKALHILPGGVGHRLYRAAGERLTAGKKGMRGGSASSVRAMGMALPHLPPGGVAVDVGTGWFHRNAFLLALAGASAVYLFDVEDSATLTHIRTYLRDLTRHVDLWVPILGTDRETVTARLGRWLGMPTREAIYADAGFRPLIVAPEALGSVTLPPVDVMVSDCVLPHIPPAVLVDELRALRAMLGPDGRMVHVIGHVDHWSWHAPGSNPYGHYRWSDRTYARWFESLEYQNRMTVPEYREAFARAGLAVETWETEHSPKDAASLRRVRVDRRFRAASFEHLSVRRSFVVLGHG